MAEKVKAAETVPVYEAAMSLFGNVPKGAGMKSWVQKVENKNAHEQNRVARVCEDVHGWRGMLVIEWAK